MMNRRILCLMTIGLILPLIAVSITAKPNKDDSEKVAVRSSKDKQKKYALRDDLLTTGQIAPILKSQANTNGHDDVCRTRIGKAVTPLDRCDVQCIARQIGKLAIPLAVE